MVTANSAVVNDYIPCPQSNRVPLAMQARSVPKTDGRKSSPMDLATVPF